MKKYSVEFANPYAGKVHHNIFNIILGFVILNRVPGHSDFGKWGFYPGSQYAFGPELAQYFGLTLHILNSCCSDGFSEEKFEATDWKIEISRKIKED